MHGPSRQVRAGLLTRQLLAFSRKQSVQPTVLDLNVVVADLGKMLRRVIGEDIELRTVPGADLWLVHADAGQVEQVLLNLVVNARDAMPSGGKLTIETANAVVDEAYVASHVAATPGEYVVLAVSDSGTGMDERVKAQVFEPFFTTKEEGRGTGLGLSTVYGIVKQHAGYIWVYSEPGRGTTFKVYLPRSHATEAATPISLQAIEPRIGTETILLVEDDRMVRRAAMRILRDAGYTVLVAGTGQDAVVAAMLHDGPIDLLLTDVVMPKMSGREVADRIHVLRPGVKVLFMSGYADNAIVHHGVLRENASFVAKPFSREALLSRVREALNDCGERTGA